MHLICCWGVSSRNRSPANHRSTTCSASPSTSLQLSSLSQVSAAQLFIVTHQIQVPFLTNSMHTRFCFIVSKYIVQMTELWTVFTKFVGFVKMKIQMFGHLYTVYVLSLEASGKPSKIILTVLPTFPTPCLVEIACGPILVLVCFQFQSQPEIASISSLGNQTGKSNAMWNLKKFML